MHIDTTVLPLGPGKLLINPERPVDGGTFKTLEVRAPERSIFAAEEPAACQWYFSSLGLLIDLVVTALAPAVPEMVAAAHFGDSMVAYLSGTDPRRGGQPFLYVMPHAGGWGAFEGGDGEDGLINNVNGGFKDYPVEIFEVKYPALIRSYGFRPDTGGPGRFRGGCGLHRTFEVVEDLRRVGAASLDLAWTAEGVLDGFFEIGLGTWDVAAGALLVAEAGGVVTDWAGDEEAWLASGDILAAPAPVHNVLLDLARGA